jgi:hypothetical protein
MDSLTQTGQSPQLRSLLVGASPLSRLSGRRPARAREQLAMVQAILLAIRERRPTRTPEFAGFSCVVFRTTSRTSADVIVGVRPRRGHPSPTRLS